MIYLQKHTRNGFFANNYKKILIILILLSFVFFGFNKSNFLQSKSSTLFSPFFKIGNFFYGSLEKKPKILSNKDALFAENESIKVELQNLRMALMDSEVIKQENVELRKALDLNTERDFIPTTIIARPPQIPFDTLLLDKGILDNVKVDDLVLVGERILIGKVVKVNDNTSTVALSSFAENSIAGIVERNSEMIEVKGMGGGGMQVKLPIDFDISISDRIITSNLPSFVFAVVSSIEEDKTTGFKDVYLSLPEGIGKIKVVFIKSYLAQ